MLLCEKAKLWINALGSTLVFACSGVVVSRVVLKSMLSLAVYCSADMQAVVPDRDTVSLCVQIFPHERAVPTYLLLVVS
jgi:hypothetical protein